LRLAGAGVRWAAIRWQTLMKTPLVALVLLLVLAVTAGPTLSMAQAADLDQAAITAAGVFRRADAGLEKLFTSSAGFAVFPTVAKGALGVGAAHGKGVVFQNNVIVADTGLTQVTIGLQLGGQSYSEIIFFETPEALGRFKEGQFVLSAQVSAVAIAEGVAANAKYVDGVAVFTIPKGGLMYEASVGGQKFSYRARR